MKLYVHSYPRSGTHYLGALLRRNFGEVDTPTGSPHLMPDRLGKLFDAEDGYHFYIWRNFNDVAASLFAKGIEPYSFVNKDISISEFCTTPWSTLFDEEVLLDGPSKGQWIPQDSRHLTPYEWWRRHVGEWIEFAETRTDVHVVTYEGLTGNFDHTMQGIAQYLGVERGGFEDITEKADPAPVREGGFHGKM